jgi:hypothetical protein
LRFSYPVNLILYGDKYKRRWNISTPSCILS